MIMNGD